MNPHERRLANEAHYRRLAATARTNQTFITPRYAMAPPEYLDDRVRDPHADQHDMYSFQPEYAPQQDSYEAAMMVRLGDTRFAGEEIVDPFPRYPQTRRLGLPRWANGSQQEIEDDHKSLQQERMSQVSLQRPRQPLPPLPPQLPPSNTASRVNEAALNARVLRAQHENEEAMKQEMAKLRQQLEEERTQTRAEITKRKEAEKKEQSAIKHQSAMAREKHDRDQEVAELKKALQEFRGDKITLTRRLDEAHAQATRAERATETHRERAATQAAEATGLKDQISSLRFTNQGLNQVVEDLRKELSDFRVEKTQLLEENAKGKEENRHLKKAMEGLASGVPNGRTIEAPQPRYTPSAAANLLSTLIISDPYEKLSEVFH